MVEPDRSHSALVASSDDQINYLTSTYTGVRSWYGHMYNTPEALARKSELTQMFEHNGQLPVANPVYYVAQRGSQWNPPVFSTKGS